MNSALLLSNQSSTKSGIQCFTADVFQQLPGFPHLLFPGGFFLGIFSVVRVLKNPAAGGVFIIS
jgi:hypothetical protein